MKASEKYDNIDQVLAEADELIKKVNAMVIEDINDRNRVEFENYRRKLIKSRSKIHESISEESTAEERRSIAEGFHEAYQEIVKAMKDLKAFLS